MEKVIKTIEYAIDGEAISDFQAENLAYNFLKSKDNYIKVSSSIFILAIRVLIKEEIIDYTNVEFLFKGQKLKVNMDGRGYWPDGFCDLEDDLISRLL